jgi:hypothetical protein
MIYRDQGCGNVCPNMPSRSRTLPAGATAGKNSNASSAQDKPGLLSAFAARLLKLPLPSMYLEMELGKESLPSLS